MLALAAKQPICRSWPRRDPSDVLHTSPGIHPHMDKRRVFANRVTFKSRALLPTKSVDLLLSLLSPVSLPSNFVRNRTYAYFVDRWFNHSKMDISKHEIFLGMYFKGTVCPALQEARAQSFGLNGPDTNWTTTQLLSFMENDHLKHILATREYFVLD